MRVNVARTLPRSGANGPGLRAVVWAQGCTLACPGCWNPDTWAFTRRSLRDVDALVAEVLGDAEVEGLTLTGGEPFQQARGFAALAAGVRAAGRSVLVFTGYELDELTLPDQRSLLAQADVVVTGRYVETLRAPGLGWRGSSNQRVHFLTQRYGPEDMDGAPEVEVLIGPDGTLTVTGFPVVDGLL